MTAIRHDVVLLCMPFGPVFSPSLGLSLLAARARERGFDVTVRYPSIQFAECVGQHFYFNLASRGRPPMDELAGEWIFAAALGGTAHDGDYITRILRGREAWRHQSLAPAISAATIRTIERARTRVPEFLADCVRDVLALQPRVVGFTSLFQQQVASLALARQIKNAAPDIFIVFGGANCEGVMGAELIRQFPFVDAVVSGEGEIVFPDLLSRMLSRQSFDDLRGVRTARSIAREFSFRLFPNAPVTPSLDDLPYPDFSDYLQQFAESRLARRWVPTLPFETSRGCWWGAKHHCTFCGLNGATMAYRSKSAARAMDELLALTRNHPGCDVQVVDTILDMQYFKTFLPELARRRPPVRLFYETKSNLRKDQVRLLRDAGVTTIQPGIESFSDAILKLMRKGVTALQNVQLLKWCKELGVQPVWNVIWGFPGEPPAEYARMAALVRRITHLPPPDGFEGLRVDRFSPNFVESDRLGFADLRPLAPYRYVFAVDAGALRNLAYFFQFRYADGYEPTSVAKPLLRALHTWKRAHRNSALFSIDVDGRLLVWDFRRRANRLFELTGLERNLYLACDQIAEINALLEIGRRASGVSDSDTRTALAGLIRRDLLIADGDRYLALAVPLGTYQPPKHIVTRLFKDLRVRARTGGDIPIRIDAALRRPSLDAARFAIAPDGALFVSSVSREPA